MNTSRRRDDVDPDDPGDLGHDDRLRGFVALGLPEGLRSDLDGALTGLRDAAPGLRWSEPDAWHLTLAFLGDVEPQQVRDLGEALRARLRHLEPVPARLALGAPGRFGTRVLWLGVDDDPAGSLATLASVVRDAATAAGIALEARPFRAHLTVARSGRASVTSNVVSQLRRGLAAVGPDPVGAPPSVADWSWPPSQVEIWRSRPGAPGPRYATLDRVRLG